nr:MAG TPA: hypothetical protein [Caudoviricetes sp.]
MTSDDFWNKDPELFNSYRTSFINKKKQQYEEYNYLCWLNGLYVHDGNNIIRSVFACEIGNMLGGKNKLPEQTYPEKPYDLFGKEKKQTKEEIKEKNRKQYFNDFNYFATMKQRFIEEVKEGKR